MPKLISIIKILQITIKITNINKLISMITIKIQLLIIKITSIISIKKTTHQKVMQENLLKSKIKRPNTLLLNKQMLS